MCAEFGITIFQGIINILVVVFLFILFINFFGLFPGTFSVSSHFIFTMTLAVPLWLSLLIMTFRKYPIIKLGRYIGTGIPAALGPPIGACEVLRAIMRPLALGLRLGANMLAGHVILSLVTNRISYGILNGGARMVAFTFISFGLFLFEAAVCVIQAYVFMLLLRIYVSEYSVY
jgi:F-type H+-transporting ATPase subunit a